MSDVSFEQILAAQNADFAQAEVRSTWMPPDGEYVVQVKNVVNGQSTDDATQIKSPWWRMTLVILVEAGDPKLKGQEFSTGFGNKTYGLLKAAAAVLSGKQINDNLKEASDVILASRGMVLKVKVERGTSKKTHKEWVGVSILEVIPTNIPAEQPEGTTPAETPAQ